MNYYNLTLPQKSIYEMEKFGEGSIATITVDMFFNGELNHKIMTRAINKVIEDNDVFRIKLDETEKEVRQYVSDYVEQDISYKSFDSQEEYSNWSTSYAKIPLNNKEYLFEVIGIHIKGKIGVILKCHHLISDAWSTFVYFRQIFNYYEMFNNNKIVEQPKYSYISYIHKDQEYINSKQYIKDRDYWKDILDSYEIPTIFSQKAGTSQRSLRKCYILDKQMENDISEYCTRNKTSEFALFLAAFGIYTYKRINQTNLYITTTVLNRTTEEEKNTGGMFVNTVPVSINIIPDCSIYDNINVVKKSIINTFRHRKYSYTEVMRDARENNKIDGKLTDISFNYQNADMGTDKKHEFSWYHCGYQTESLIVHVRRNADKQVEIYYDYQDVKFEEWEIYYINKHYYNILKAITHEDSTTAEQLFYLGNDEVNQIIGDFNNTQIEYDDKKTVVDLFEEQVKKQMHNTAVVFEGKEITYANLNERANQLAYRLRELGVRPDDKVVILTQRNIEMIIGISGIIKSGGAYVPIDIDYPKERIKYIIEDCQPKVILCEKDEVPIETDIPVISIFDTDVCSKSIDNPDHVNTTNDLVYVIYTSGTTGKPKGVMIEHSGVANLREYFIRNQAITESDVVLQFASIAFDAAVSEMTMSLLTDGKLCICPEYVKKDPKLFEQYVIDHNVTIAIMPPQYLAQVNVKHFRAVITAGSETNQELVSINSKYMKYSNDYGPTEATVCATHWECDPNDPVSTRIPIGKPIENKQVYIMNFNELCGIGMPGELCIAGIGLARGYVNKKELTEEKFIKNPFGEGRMYRTGDQARWLPDGNIEYLGRIDDQVKIRGFRVELGEIENVLRKQTDVKDAAVVVREKNGYKIICAYLVSDNQMNFYNIKESIRKELPEYMIPAYIMQIKNMPLTLNGKLNKRALPEPEMASEQEYAEPRNKIEKVLVEVFEEVLGVSHIGIKNNFFEMGGDSIKAMSIVSKMRGNGYELAVKDLIELRIVKLIAEKVTAIEKVNIGKQEEVSGLAPLTPIQRMFFSWNYVKSNHFNQAIMICGKNGFEKDALKESVKAITTHHDILRSVYADKLQEILSVTQSKLFDWKEFDLKTTNNVHEFIEYECANIQSSMDIDKGPLVKAASFGTLHEDYLLLCIHHLVVDGVSWRIILEDLINGYEQALQGKNIILPAKTTSYRDWADALEEYAKGEELKQQIEYWTRVSEKSECGRIEGDLNNNLVEYKHLSMELDEENTKRLLYEVGKAHETEINDVLLSALGIAVKQWKGQECVTVELEGHGREKISDKVDINRTVGWFTSVYSIVLDVCEDIEEMIIKTKEMLRKVPSHGIGYNVAKYLGNCESIDVKSDLCFNYLGDFNKVFKVGDKIEVSYLPVESNSAKENLPKQSIVINGSILDGKLQFDIAYNKGKYSDDSINRFQKHYMDSLHKVISWAGEYVSKQKSSLSNTITELLNGYGGDCSSDKIEISYPPLFVHRYFLKKIHTSVISNCEITGFSLTQVMEAVQKIISLQSVLRTLYNPQTGCFEECAYSKEWNVPYIDLDEIGVREDVFMSNLDIDLASMDFVSNRSMLGRIFVMRKAKEKYQVVVCIHHSIWDRMSYEIFEAQLNELLSGKGELMQAYSYAEYILDIERRKKEYKLTEKEDKIIEKYMDIAENFSLNCKKINHGTVSDIKTHLSKSLKDYFENQPIEAIMTLLYGFMEHEVLLKPLKEIPYVVLHHNRNETNKQMLGLYLDIWTYLYNVENRQKNNIGLDGIDMLLMEKIELWSKERDYKLRVLEVPKINWIGSFHEMNNRLESKSVNTEINIVHNADFPGLSITISVHGNQLSMAVVGLKIDAKVLSKVLRDMEDEV